MQPEPPKGQGGYARKVLDTVVERDRLKAMNVDLLEALESIYQWVSDAEPAPEGARRIAWDVKKISRAVIAKAKESTS